MIFSNEQEVADFIESRPYGKEIDTARLVSKSLYKYVTGEGLVESIGYLPYFEKAAITDLKKKLVKSTRDMVTRLLQPMDRVFTAKGGVRAYYLPENKEEEFADYLDNVRKGMSMKEWMQNVSFKAYLCDPMSLMFTEIGKDGNPYPTYKSTEAIYCYLLNGRTPEAVCFALSDEEIKALVKQNIIPEPENDATIYRIVDGLQDIIGSYSAKVFTRHYSSKHGFKGVPGLITSDILAYDGKTYESPLMPVIELIAEYFDGDADKALYKKAQLHPREWSIVLDCPKCEGEKIRGGEDCDHCNGTGIQPHLKIADRINVVIGEDGKAAVPTPPGGYYSAPVEPWDKIKEDLAFIEMQCENTLYEKRGQNKVTGPQVKDAEVTATGEIMQEKSKEPKLKKISKWGAGTEKKLTDWIKQIKYRSNTDSTVVWGDRYLHGTVDELAIEYHNMVKNGAPAAFLDSMLLDILEAKFETNPLELAKQKKLIYVEPYVHYRIEQVAVWAIDDKVKLRKIYFPEWLNTMTNMDITNPKNTETVLLAMLDKYIAEKGYSMPEPEPVKQTA